MREIREREGAGRERGRGVEKKGGGQSQGWKGYQVIDGFFLTIRSLNLGSPVSMTAA